MRYYFNLIGYPVLFLIVTTVTFTISEHLMNKQDSMVFALITYYIGVIAALFAMAIQIHNLWRVWLAYQKPGEACNQCLAPTSKHNGPHNQYMKCWKCGHKQPIL